MNENIQPVNLQQQLDKICGTNSSPQLRQQLEGLLKRYDTETLQITPENLEQVMRYVEQLFTQYCEARGYSFLAVTQVLPRNVSNPEKFYYLIYGQATEPTQHATVPLHVGIRMKEEQRIVIVGQGVKENPSR